MMQAGSGFGKIAAMKWLSICLLFALCLTGCQKKRDGTPIIASVNGDTVSRAEFTRYLTVRLGDIAKEEMPATLHSQLLDEYLLRQLVSQEAKRQGLTITDSDIEQAMQEAPQKKASATDEEGRKDLAIDLLVQKYYKQQVLNTVKVTPEQIEEYIEANKSRLSDKPGFYVREIRVASREEAERIRREIVEQQSDFVQMVRTHSQASNAEEGGLARYTEGQMPTALENAIKPLRPGDVSQVVQSSYGFHLFRLERRTQVYPEDAQRAKLDDRRALLGEELVVRRNQEAIDAALNRLATAAKVKIEDAQLGFTYEGRFRQN